MADEECHMMKRNKLCNWTRTHFNLFSWCSLDHLKSPIFSSVFSLQALPSWIWWPEANQWSISMQKLDPSLKICCHFEEYSKVICIPRLCNHPPTHHQICDHVHTWWGTDTRQGSCTTCCCRQYACHLAGVINTNYISLLIAYNRQQARCCHVPTLYSALLAVNTEYRSGFLSSRSSSSFLFWFYSTSPKSSSIEHSGYLKNQNNSISTCCIVTLLLILMSADYNL